MQAQMVPEVGATNHERHIDCWKLLHAQLADHSEGVDRVVALSPQAEGWLETISDLQVHRAAGLEALYHSVPGETLESAGVG